MEKLKIEYVNINSIKPYKNNAYFVYIHIFPNNKKYVGITSQIPQRRWRNGDGYKSQEMITRAINKAIKNTNKKFIAVSCHKDIIEWLQPDWLFDTDTMQQVFQLAHDLKKNLQLEVVGEKNGKSLGDIII